MDLELCGTGNPQTSNKQFSVKQDINLNVKSNIYLRDIISAIHIHNSIHVTQIDGYMPCK